MNNVINFYNEDKCYGCLACYNICPNNAINLVITKKGFVKPTIVVDKCINCKLCKRVCGIKGMKE